MSQEVLAGLVGRTVDWLSKAENNRLELDRLSVIKSLADALDVSLGDLLAEPTLMDWTPEPSSGRGRALNGDQRRQPPTAQQQVRVLIDEAAAGHGRA
ncbi:helix-turn-helix domain-containing protein [Streptomyces canus]|uniref:helix-turn-helix domain-containing protein n=1 Tax=Streptomyces canus TaxID=58343 RepID=UPI003CE80C3C